jgi:DNA-binding CsgD family transcriptional regulator
MQMASGKSGRGAPNRQVRNRPGGAMSDLTERELEILEGAAHGETAQETALRLHLAAETIRRHRTTARRKLRAKNLTHAVAQWLQPQFGGTASMERTGSNR